MKLTYVTATMNAGKTARLLQMNYDYSFIGKKTILLKPALDTRESTIKSRNGLEAECFLINSAKDIKQIKNVDIVFVDEVQFLTKKEINALRKLTKKGIAVYAFGLRTTFQGKLFKGSKRLLEIADEVVELNGMCKCGEKATMNLKYDNKSGKVIKKGNAIDCGYEDMYMAVCYKHWKAKNIKYIK